MTLVLLISLLALAVPATGAAEGAEPDALAVVMARCGACHGVSADSRCLAGNCRTKSHAIDEPRAWTLVLAWMRALGCQISEAEQATLERYLMSRYGRAYPIEWQPLDPVPAGWNVVALSPFRDRLYAGVEGAGAALRLEGRSWRPVLTTDAYTVYGLVPFRGRLFAGTNQPRAEVWSSSDGSQWSRDAVLPEAERGVIALGVFRDALYAGTTRARVYRSTDGREWAPAGAPLPGATNGFQNWVRFLIPFNGRLYAGVEGAGVFASRDGVTWERAAGEAGPAGGVRAAVVAEGALYVGTTSSGEVWRMSGEERWTRVFAAPPGAGPYVASLATVGGDLYASVNGRVFRSRDRVEWTEVGALTPFTVEAMREFDGALYAGTTLPPRAWVYRAPVSPASERGRRGIP